MQSHNSAMHLRLSRCARASWYWVLRPVFGAQNTSPKGTGAVVCLENVPTDRSEEQAGWPGSRQEGCVGWVGVFSCCLLRLRNSLSCPHPTRCLPALGCTSWVHLKFLFWSKKKKKGSKYLKLVLTREENLVQGGYMGLFQFFSPLTHFCLTFI